MKRRALVQFLLLGGASIPLVSKSQRGDTRWAVSTDQSRIAYEVVGNGPDIVLVHPFGSSRDSWRQFGYVNALASDFRLILIDAKGHGDSDGPVIDEAYSHRAFADDIAAVVKRECSEPATLWGYSMGGRIAMSCMAYTSELYGRFILGGHGSSILGMPEAYLQTLRATADRYAAGHLTEEESESLVRPNLPALAASMRQSLVFEPMVGERMKAVNRPTLIYVGEVDATAGRAIEEETGVRMLDFFADPTWVELPGLTHREGYERSDLVLPHVTAFLGRT